MNSIALATIKHHPAGLFITTKLSHLPPGEYALIQSEEKGKSDVLKLTTSHGTDFYKYLSSISIPFAFIVSTNLLPNYPVELNASPVSSESQEYAKDALIFNI